MVVVTNSGGCGEAKDHGYGCVAERFVDIYTYKCVNARVYICLFVFVRVWI